MLPSGVDPATLARAIAAHPARVRPAAELPADAPALPVAIVGAGACGMTAALALHQAGIDCVLIERDASPQGSTALSSGFIPAGGTAVQRAAGVADDSPARFAADIQAKAHGQAAPELVAAYTQAIVPAIDALQQRHGLGFELLDGFLYPGHSLHRMHTLPQRTGAALVAALQAAVARCDIPLLTEATVRQLYADAQGRIHGIGYQRPDGQREQLRCQALILACNGFGGQRDLVRLLLPAMAEAAFGGHTGNDGSAIAWGTQLGAALADLGGCQGHGAWAVPQGCLITWALVAEGGIQVNRRGQRLHEPGVGYSEAALTVLQQPGAVAWNVLDDRLLALGRGFPDFVQAEGLGAVRHAADVAGLAAVIGCPAESLRQALAGTAMATASGPLHAIQVTGALFHTQGGLAIDAGCRVLRADGRPLPNLLAAGGAARGVSGPELSGYLSGNGLLSAVAGGWIAAHTAARAVVTTGPA